MKSFKQCLIVIMTISFSMVFSNSSSQDYLTNRSQERSAFQWPEGKKMAVSFTFDDARLTQIDKGMPLFDRYNVKATFYVSRDNMVQRLEGWKEAVRRGHDIGNHSLLHPCTVNYGWPPEAQLETYTLQRMKIELDSASVVIKDLLGIQPVSFAYPCGQTYVGTGVNTKSYIPLVASLFESGRIWLSEGPNDPVSCDMAQLTGMELDGKSFDQVKALIESAGKKGQWLILAGHEINNDGRQTSLLSTIEEIIRYAADPANGIWIDNVHNIASYVKEKRGEARYEVLPVYRNPMYLIETRVEDLLSRMTLEEKLGQLNMPAPGMITQGFDQQIDACRKFAEGKLVENIGPAGGIWAPTGLFKDGPRKQAEFLNALQKIAAEKTRLKIPLLFMEEGTHGLLTPGATVFPEGLAIGSAWNTDLVRQIYSVAGKEGRTRGVHFLGTLVVEPNRDPRLGRNEEGYSEDPYLCSQIVKAIVEGMQGDDLTSHEKAIALLCHFPGQSQPVSGMERGAMEISERTLREIFLPPWVAGIKKSGALGVMATYPAIDGLPAHVSEKLLTKVLREELDFNGLVFCEGAGIGIPVYEQIVSTMKEAGELCLKAGVDVSIWHEDGYMNTMRENVQEGKVSIETVDRAVRRILRIKFLLGLFENPYVDVERAVREANTAKSQQLALQTAREGIVLLKNEKNLLPLSKNIKSIAVIGPNADDAMNQLGDYTSQILTQDIVTVLEGIRSKVSSGTKVSYVKGCEIIGNKLNEISKAKAAAKSADLAIVVLGETSNRPGTNGEGYDVANLDLTGLQEDLLKAVYSSGTPTIVVLINGRPLSVRWAAENIPAIVEAWNCGEQGGNAIADIIFGDYNPGGRLPITVARHSGQLPVYYNSMPSKDYWIKEGWGAKGYADMSALPLYPFGFGLSYTTFRIQQSSGYSKSDRSCRRDLCECGY